MKSLSLIAVASAVLAAPNPSPRQQTAVGAVSRAVTSLDKIITSNRDSILDSSVAGADTGITQGEVDEVGAAKAAQGPFLGLLTGPAAATKRSAGVNGLDTSAADGPLGTLDEVLQAVDEFVGGINITIGSTPLA